jgi:lysophospholipase L1-like esterase
MVQDPIVRRGHGGRGASGGPVRRSVLLVAVSAVAVIASSVVPLAPAQAAVPRIMVVGDSISQGSSGDFTWRYRLHKNLVAQGVSVDMVGPRNDIFNNVTGVQGDTRYADPSFDRDHDAVWGRAAVQEKDTIAGEVSAAAPDYMLLLLGINDIVWLTDAAGADAALRALITNARTAKPNLKIVMGKVLPTTRAVTDAPFAAKVDDLNSRIAAIASSMSTGASPIAVAATPTGFVAADDTYDGVHPNARGELKIAAAFQDALAAKFALGAAFPRPLPGVMTGPRTAPTLSVTNGNGSAGLAWTESPGATGYWVWTRNVIEAESFHKLPLPLTMSYNPWTAGLLSNGGVYEFKLETTKGDNTGAFSNVVTARPTGPTPAGPNVSVSNLDGAARLSWTSVANSTGSYVWTRNVTEGEAFHRLPIALPQSSSPWTAGLLANGGVYEFKLQSVNGYIDGGYSNVVTARPTGPAPGASTLSVTPGNRSATLKWTAASNATGYYVWTRSPSFGETTFTKLPIPISGTTWTSSQMAAGAIYDYRIQPMNGYLGGTLSNIATVVPTGILPAAPSLTVSYSGSTTTLNWNAVANATSYDIYYQNVNYGQTTWTKIDSWVAITATSYQPFLEWGQTMRYRVVPVNGLLAGAPSNSVRARLASQEYNQIADWMSLQIRTNSVSQQVQDIHFAMTDCPRIDPQGAAGCIAAGLLEWKNLVCTGCVWDHKPQIATYWNDRDHYFADVLPGTSLKVYYDIWSNIHYGYVGSAAGIDRGTLITGSHISEGAGNTDAGDDLSINIGVDLFNAYGATGLTTARLDAAIRSHLSQWQSLTGNVQVRAVDDFS